VKDKLNVIDELRALSHLAAVMAAAAKPALESAFTTAAVFDCPHTS
jgi:hypothetical protein